MNPVSRWANDHQTEELLHIERMITELDRLMRSGHVDWPVTGVTSVGYWRRRIHAVVAPEQTPRPLAERASAMLRKLDGMRDCPE
jgi:hypothetical protein